jgi:hypothetical protein
VVVDLTADVAGRREELTAAAVCMGTRVGLAVGVGAAVAGGAELLRTGVGVEVGDVEGPGDVELVAVRAGEEVAVLPHPAASMAVSVSAAIFRGSRPANLVPRAFVQRQNALTRFPDLDRPP